MQTGFPIMLNNRAKFLTSQHFHRTRSPSAYLTDRMHHRGEPSRSLFPTDRPRPLYKTSSSRAAGYHPRANTSWLEGILGKSGN